MDIYEDMAAWYAGLHDYILATPQFEPLRPLFPVTVEQMSDPHFAGRVHARAIITIIDSLNTANQSLMVAAIDGFLRQRLFLPSVGGGVPEETRQATAALAKRGYTGLPAIDAGRLADMRRHFEGKEMIHGMHLYGKGRSSVEEARHGNNIGRFPTHTVLTCPHLVEIASDPEVLSVVENHLGTIPTIIGYFAWWSFADPAEAREAQFFHRDIEDYRFCKQFVYLTDVDTGGGPHVYMEGTHDGDTVAALRRRWADEVDDFDTWLFRRFWKDEADTLRYCAAEPVTLTGAAGSRLLVDVLGLHKGLVPKTSDRLICVVLYGVSPRLNQEWDPLRTGTPDAAHVPDWVRRRPIDYVNRMYLA